jgi:Cdc25 family phosphatase
LVDHIGGHIKHAQHIASATLDHRIPELVRKLQGTETVVFHCALSQQRGPRAALLYLRERERLLGPAPGKLQMRNKEEEMNKQGESEWEDVEDAEKEDVKEQKVYVLDRGFVGWQEQFGTDPRLTEGYRREIWRNA